MIIAQVKSIVLPMLLAVGTVAAGVVVAATQLSGGTDGCPEQPSRRRLRIVAKAKRAGNQGSQQTAKSKVFNSQSQPQSNQAAQGPAMATAGGMMGGMAWAAVWRHGGMMGGGWAVCSAE